MPLGSLVSPFPFRYENSTVVTWYCSGSHQYGIGHGYINPPDVTVTPGVSVLLNLPPYRPANDNADEVLETTLTSDVFTTPELQARGLGYILASRVSATRWCSYSEAPSSEYVFGESPVIPFHPDESSGAPISQYITSTNNSCQRWHNGQIHNGTAGGVQRVHLTVYYAFVKIGDASQHGTLPQSFTTPVITFFIANRSNPSHQIATAAFSFYATDFSSRVVQSTCTTPSASESVIYFGTIFANAVPNSPGATIAERDFTVAFHCPHNDYYLVSFWVEPIYGLVADNTNSAGSYYPAPYSLGTMNIASGPGMAKGVGVQLSINSLPSMNYPDSYSYSYDSDNSYKYRVLYGPGKLYHISHSPRYYPTTNPGQVVHSRTYYFRARLIRLNEPLVAGQIKAAALIHIRYN